MAAIDLINPIFIKDTKICLRKSRAALLQLLFIGSCFLLTVMLWPQEGVYSLAAQSARQLFTVLGMGQLTLVVLFAPAFTSVALTMEKERNTMDLLYGTLMSPASIAWGKIVGGLFFLVLVVLSSIPITCVCLALGGVDMPDVLMLYLVLCLTALSFGMIGLMVSSLCQQTHIAVIITYGIIIVLSGIVVIPSILFIRQSAKLAVYLHTARSISPFVAMISVVQPKFFVYTGEMKVQTPPWQIFATVSLAISIACTAVMFFVLRKCPAPKPRRETAQGDEKLLKRLSHWPFYLINPKGRRGMIGLLMNPVLVKEFRTKTFGRLINLVRGIYTCFFISMGLMILCAFSSFLFTVNVIAVFVICFQLMLVMFIAPIMSAPLISAEVESGQFDLLRITRLNSWTIITGKFEAVLFPIVIMLIATIPPYFVITYIEPNLLMGVIRSTATVLATVFFFCAAGLCFSSFSSKTARAIAGTYTLVVVVCVLSLLGLLARGILSDRILEWMFKTNPIIAALSQVSLPLLKDYNLWQPNLIFLIAGGLLLLIIGSIRVSFLVRPK